MYFDWKVKWGVYVCVCVVGEEEGRWVSMYKSLPFFTQGVVVTIIMVLPYFGNC